MNSTPVGLAQVHTAKGVAVSLRCPHCDHIIQVPANGGPQESIDALATWRLGVHVNTLHPEITSATTAAATVA